MINVLIILLALTNVNENSVKYFFAPLKLVFWRVFGRLLFVLISAIIYN